jgi:hypothetical protein
MVESHLSKSDSYYQNYGTLQLPSSALNCASAIQFIAIKCNVTFLPSKPTCTSPKERFILERQLSSSGVEPPRNKFYENHFLVVSEITDGHREEQKEESGLI